MVFTVNDYGAERYNSTHSDVTEFTVNDQRNLIDYTVYSCLIEFAVNN